MAVIGGIFGAIKVEPYWNVKNRQSNTGGDTGN